MKKKTASTLLVIFLAFLPSCRVGPDYHPPAINAPTEWKHPSNEEAVLPCVDNWWEIFDDESLNSLEEEAVENNKDLLIALDRVAQARAQVGIAVSALYPQINLNPLYNDQDNLVKFFTPKGEPKPASPYLREHTFIYSLPLNLSYEIDLWGQLSDQYDAAKFNFQAQEQAYLTTLLILTSDVASTYFQIRALDTLIELFSKTITTRKKALDINQSRYDYKIIDYSAVALSGLDLSNVQSQYYGAMQQRELEVDALALLLGRPPVEVEIEYTPLKDPPPTVPACMPSKVILQRPDVANAERIMASEHSLIDSNIASLFPTLTLTGALGFLSPDYKNFLKWMSRYWQMGANITQPIFDGGHIFSEIDLSWANFSQANHTYQQTVLSAFRDVEDALASLEWLAKEAESVQNSVNYAQEAYNISMDRYLRGVDFYLQVADNERQLLDNQRELATILESQYITTVQLIKAIGGRW